MRLDDDPDVSVVVAVVMLLLIAMYVGALMGSQA